MDLIWEVIGEKRKELTFSVDLIVVGKYCSDLDIVYLGCLLAI